MGGDGVRPPGTVSLGKVFNLQDKVKRNRNVIIMALEYDVNPKQVFSNERTYIEWVQMSITLGGIAIGLLGFSFPTKGSKLTKAIHQHEVSNIVHDGDIEVNRGHRVSQNIGLILLPVAILFGVYGTWLYLIRRKKIVENIGDSYYTYQTVGPILLGATTFCALVSVFLIDLLTF